MWNAVWTGSLITLAKIGGLLISAWVLGFFYD